MLPDGAFLVQDRLKIPFLDFHLLHIDGQLNVSKYPTMASLLSKSAGMYRSDQAQVRRFLFIDHACSNARETWTQSSALSKSVRPLTVAADLRFVPPFETLSTPPKTETARDEDANLLKVVFAKACVSSIQNDHGY